MNFDVANLTAAGLAYDGFGVLILGYAFFSRSLKDILIESSTFYDRNQALLESLIRSKTDGVFGTVLLILGFLIQWLGSIGLSSEIWSVTLYILLFAVLGSYWIAGRRVLVKNQIQTAENIKIDDGE